MALTSNEEYINKLKELSKESKLVLDQAAAKESGATASFNTAVSNHILIKKYADNIEGTNVASKPLISSLASAEDQVEKVRENTNFTVGASDVLIIATQKLAQLTEELDTQIKTDLVQKIEADGDANEKSPKITSAMETLQTSMQAALEAALKAYEDSLSFYHEITIFKNILNTGGPQQRGDLRDDIHLLNDEIKKTFPLDNDDYYKKMQAKLPEASKSVEKKREVLEASQKDKGIAQTEFDAISASLAAAEAANGG